MTPLAGLASHLAILPVAVPLVAGTLLLLIAKRGRRLTPLIGLASLGTLLAIAVTLLVRADQSAALAYPLGNWPAPFGIVLVADRLAALMLVITALIAIACQLAAREAASLRFPALLQWQVAGLSGAFLTGDLFNLFVCFEMLLAASYALLLDRTTPSRLRAGLHYVAINLIGSSLFLIAAALFYGVAGSLNLADLAARLPLLAPQDLALVRVAGLLLLVVFAIKAAALPLGLWLPGTYGAAPAHVAALFAIMTKVGIYAIARVHGTLFGADAGGALAGLAQPLLLPAGLATLALGALGAFAARDLRALVAWLVVGSAGTLLTALGVGTREATAAALFYLPHSTFAAGALFLIVECIARGRDGAAAAADTDTDTEGRYRIDGGSRVRGAALVGTLFFAAALMAAGLPPGAGFIGKALLLSAAQAHPLQGWIWALVLTGGLITLLALVRAASAVFWKPAGRAAVPANTTAPATKAAATTTATATASTVAPSAGLVLATLWLLAAGLLLVLCARPVHDFLLRAAAALEGA
jgi:multicomponent K+:H+ antiporter subunit D